MRTPSSRSHHGASSAAQHTVEVCIGEAGAPVGLLRFNQDGARESAVFQYSASWMADSQAFAIDPALPRRSGPHFRKRHPTGSVFPLAIADTEPDGWARRVIQRDHAKRRVRARAEGSELPPLTSSLDYLLAVDDVSRVGALRFRFPGAPYSRSVTAGARATPPLLELPHMLDASRALERDEETAADLAYLLGKGTSLGGMRPKCSIVDDDGTLAIGKFPSIGDERSVTRGEVLALRLAARAGIHAADARIVLCDEVPVAIIRRFDRMQGQRIPYCSAATLLSAEPHQQYAYTDIADALRQHGADVPADIEELWRRIAFSILIGNIDDHLHNHGFLHADGEQWRLAPAFDVNPFPDRVRELKTWISPDTGPAASIDALMDVAPYFGIALPRVREVLAQVEGAVNDWSHVGRELGMTAHDLEQFADAFEHAERLAARRLMVSHY